jgi:hypothetical protein
MDICVLQDMKLMLHLVPLLLMVSLSAVQPKVPLNKHFCSNSVADMEYGIRCLFDPWIRDRIPNPGSPVYIF